MTSSSEVRLGESPLLALPPHDCLPFIRLHQVLCTTPATLITPFPTVLEDVGDHWS